MKVASFVFHTTFAIWINTNNGSGGGANAQYVSGRVEVDVTDEDLEIENYNCFYPGIVGRPIGDNPDGTRRNLRRDGQEGTTVNPEDSIDANNGKDIAAPMEQEVGQRKLEEPKPILTFWKCGHNCLQPGRRLQTEPPEVCKCKCSISRIVDLNTIPAGYAVAMEIGEYGSESACNSNCKRDSNDLCWVCVESQIFPAGQQVKQCKHVQDTWITGPLKKNNIQCCPPKEYAAVEKYCFP